MMTQMLPVELWEEIFQHLHRKELNDLLALRQTCKHFRNLSRPYLKKALAEKISRIVFYEDDDLVANYSKEEAHMVVDQLFDSKTFMPPCIRNVLQQSFVAVYSKCFREDYIVVYRSKKFRTFMKDLMTGRVVLNNFPVNSVESLRFWKSLLTNFVFLYHTPDFRLSASHCRRLVRFLSLLLFKVPGYYRDRLVTVQDKL